MFFVINREVQCLVLTTEKQKTINFIRHEIDK